MFASMFESLFKKSEKNCETNKKESELESIEVITTQDVEDMLIELDEIKDNSHTDSHCSTSKDIAEAIDVLSIADTNSEFSNDNDLDDCFDDTTSEVSSIGENNLESNNIANETVDIKIVKQINNLLCPFTWNIKPNKNKNVISIIQNKYGQYNLNISSPEFTFERYIGNLVISYEMFHKGDIELAQLKVLEIGKWLEELDSGTDEFYLSINTGLQHVMKATFIHMLFATNLTGECKWLLDDIVPFNKMDSRSKAAVNAVRAAVMIEYGGNGKYFKKACEYANKACEIDPVTSHWFYIYSLVLTAQRHYLYTYKSCPKENEINAIQQAIMLSDGKNTSYNYHRMTLDRDIVIRNYHDNTNKNDKVMIEKNLQSNKTIVQMIKTIVSMEPKDPHIVIKCAKILMTLPVKVRDFNLGKQYLIKAFQMAPNDVTVLKAVEKTIENYKEMTKKNYKHRATETKQNQSPFMNKASKLTGDLRNIVKKHNKGEDAVPYLLVLAANYNGHDKWKIMAQICSYTILFKNNLRAGVEQFIPLIEQPGMSNNNLITNHYSSFGSKKFNLAELICNEIRLATNSSKTSSEDMLFYYRMLTKIMETCNVKVKEVDSSMKNELIIDSSAKFTSMKHQSETEWSKNDESLNSKNKNTNNVPKFTPKNHRPKHMENTGPNVFAKRPEFNKGGNKMNSKSNNSFSTNTQSNANWTNNSIDQMKFKMSKFANTNSVTSNDQFRFSNNSDPLDIGNLRNLRTQSEIEHYTQQLYQNIVNDGQRQNNSQFGSSGGFGRYRNQNHSHMNSSFQQNPSENPYPPSLLSLRPTWPNEYSKKK